MRTFATRVCALFAAFLLPHASARGQAWIACIERFPNSVPFVAGGVTDGALAFEAGSGRVFWIGGVDTLGRMRTSVYEWTGHAWIERAISGGPAARRHAALTSLAPKPGILLHGGMDERGETRAETWLFTGTEWKLLTTRGPVRLWMHALAYDAARDRVVLFGGDVNGRLDFPIYELWEFDGLEWLRRLAPLPPTRRFGHALVYDPLRQRTIVFGGFTNQGVALNDQWEWDGYRWTQIQAAVQPSPRGFARCTFDAARGKVLLSGGTASLGGAALDELWEFDAAPNAWTRLVPFGTGPAERESHGMAFDPVRQRTLIVGGTQRPPSGRRVLSDTWELHATVPVATLTPYGNGCAGSYGVPRLTTSGLPRVGSANLALALAPGRPNSVAVFLFALAPGARPLGTGCTLLVEEPWFPLVTSTDAGGLASLPLGLPASNGILGLELFLQAFVADPFGGASGVASASPGLGILIGR